MRLVTGVHATGRASSCCLTPEGTERRSAFVTVNDRAVAAADELAAMLTDDALVTDPDIIVGYRRDRADLVPAGMPAGMVRARSTADVSATLCWASTHRVPVVPRGAGTGLAGGANAVDGCIVLSLERMTAIREVSVDDHLAVVEPGVINADLGRAALARGLFYPPDPGSLEISTLGGNLATNAGGLRCVKYGVTRDSVLGLEVVLADGRVLRTGGRTIKNVAGYDLSRLFVGSEGTLGIITAAILRLRPKPPVEPVTVVASFATLSAATEAAVAIMQQGLQPSLLELMDRETIGLVEDYRPMGLDRSAAALLIGQADDPTAPRTAERMLVCFEAAGAQLAIRSTDPAEATMLLAARRLSGEAMMAAGTTVIEDISVPRSQLGRVTAELTEIAGRHEVRIATVGHVGDGNLHPTFVLADTSEETMARVMAAAEEVWRAALSAGGTITGEHGVGTLKRPWLAAELDETALGVHAAVKSALDPLGILNPGKAF